MTAEEWLPTAISPCWRCGKVPSVYPDSYPTVSCDDCYDGAPDSTTRHELGSGMNAEQAIADWNENMAALEADEADELEELSR